MMSVFTGRAGRWFDKGLDDRYEIVTCLRKAVDNQGRTGVYRVVFSPHVAELAATEDELLEDAYGDYPLVVFSREVLSNRLLDSRGWPEVAGPGQALIKWLMDLATNVTALKTLPPVRAPRSRREEEILIAPLAIIRESRPKEVSAFTDFEYPREALELARLMETAILQLAALPAEGVNSQMTELLQLDEVKDLLAGMEEFYALVMCQLLANMPPEMLERIAGGPLEVSPEDLAWKVAVVLSFDPRHLDREFVKDWLTTMSNLVLPMDQGSVIMRDTLVRLSVRMLEPGLSEDLVRPGDEAQASEVEEERRTIAEMLAGFDAPGFEFDAGIDFRTRFGVLREWLDAQQGPEGIWESLPTGTQERVLRHYENLQQQLVQMDNQDVGRTGVQQNPPDVPAGE